MTDVAIVGAGPAGSSLGLALARAGYDVTLIERARFPRVKVCGDYLCPGAVASLAGLGIADEVLAGAQSIRSLSLNGFGAQVRMRIPGEGARSLPRSTFDQRILASAQSAGARVLRGVFLQAREEGSRLRIDFRDERGLAQTLTARMLVGADGAWSSVAQRAGMAPATRPRGNWAVGGLLRKDPAGEELEMHIGAAGYYARNPLTSNIVNTMLVQPVPSRGEQADSIVEQITAGARSFEHDKIEQPVAVGPLRYRAACVARGRILLTGDAAELLDPFTGQGVATAIALASPASAAVRALLDGERQDRVAGRYAAQWRSIVAPRRALTRLIEAVIRVGFLRQRALRNIRNDGRVAHALLAGVSDTARVHEALTPATLWRLLAS
jgi:flavin-dependent dehydrogenase